MQMALKQLEQNTAKYNSTVHAMSARPVDNQHNCMLLFLHREAIVPRNLIQKKAGFVMTQTTNDLLTVREVSRALRVDDTTVRRWIKNSVLEAIALPHRGKRQAYRVKNSTLARLLETTTVAAV